MNALIASCCLIILFLAVIAELPCRDLAVVVYFYLTTAKSRHGSSAITARNNIFKMTFADLRMTKARLQVAKKTQKVLEECCSTSKN